MPNPSKTPNVIANHEPEHTINEDFAEPPFDLPVFPDALVETDLTDKTVSISNGEFMAEIFSNIAPECQPMVVSIPNKLDDKSFRKYGKGKPQGDANIQCPAANNNYFSLSTYKPDENGNYHRQKKHFNALHCIMLDDICTKVPLESIKLRPSWAIETSERNYQFGYIIKAPINSETFASKLGKELTERELTDKGAGGFTARLARLPVAQNTKREEAFVCRMAHWEPETKYQIDDFLMAFDIHVISSASPQKKAKKSKNSILAQSSIYIPKPDENPVIVALKENGLYKQPLGNGKHDITCPWVNEHTDVVDGGTAYFEPNESYPLGGFKCLHSHGEGQNISNLLDYVEIDFSAAKMKPIIRITAGELHYIADVAELELSYTEQYYQRGGLIVAVMSDPSTHEIAIKTISNPALTAALSKHIAWEAYDGRAGSFVPKDPTSRIVSIVQDAQQYQHLPILKGIAHQPYLRDDYSLVSDSGYDEKSEIYGAFNPKDFNVNITPTKGEALAALKKIDTLLDDFGFANETDRSAALAAILTAAIRPSLPLAPMFHAKAPMIGSGKSFLCQVIAVFATQRIGTPTAFPSEEEECRKLLLSELLRAPTVIEFDNLTTDLQAHKSLCTALTSEHLSDRILGVSKTATVSTRTLFLSSGNNVSPINDMVRRCITINLDTGCELPFAREYKNPNLLEDLRESRGEYVSAALTVIMGWLASGTPKPECKNFSTYNEWSKLCRYPLLWLGYEDPVASVFTAMNDDPETETLQILLREWYRSFADKPMMIRQALDISYNASTELRDVFSDIASERDMINRRRLGHYIKRHQNRIIDGLKFVKDAGNHSAAAWKVVKSVSSEISVSSSSNSKNSMEA